MQLRLKTKITLTTAALVLAVVGVNSTLYGMMTLTRQVIRQANDRAQLVSRHVFFQAQNALANASRAGEAPASDSPEDLRAFFKRSLDESAAVSVLGIAAEVESPLSLPKSRSLMPRALCSHPVTILWSEN